MAGILLTLSAALYSERIQGEIAANVIRLHVLANSDAPHDQELKLLVRDVVLTEIAGWLDGNEGLDESRAVLSARLPDIAAAATELAGTNVTASLTHSRFPTMIYKNATLPAGIYETLRISIGAADGRNWWCVVFPPLCLFDAVQVSIDCEEPTRLAAVLSDETYNIVKNPDTVRVRFKTVEVWQRMRGLFNNDG